MQSTKIEEVVDMKSALTLDMELQRLEFAQLVCCLGLVQCFLTMTFWNGSVYPVILEVCGLLFDFDFTVKRLHESQRRLRTFGLLKLLLTMGSSEVGLNVFCIMLWLGIAPIDSCV